MTTGNQNNETRPTPEALLAAALEYAAKGWQVFPLAEGRKVPLTQRGVHDCTTDETTIREWWGRWPTANVAIACGASDLLVVDVDAIESDIFERLPETLTARTRSGGWHLYYKQPSAPLGNTAKKMHPDCDTRGTGGYVVAPPSWVNRDARAAGGRYMWVGDADRDANRIVPAIPVAPLPEWVIDALAPRREESVTMAVRGPGSVVHGSFRPREEWGRKALDDEMVALAQTPEGARNSEINRVCFKVGQIVGGGNLLASEARDAIVATVSALCPDELKKAIGTAERAFLAGLEAPRHPVERAMVGMPIHDVDDGMPCVLDGEVVGEVAGNGGALEGVGGSKVHVGEQAPPKPPTRGSVRTPSSKDQAQWELLREVMSLGEICEAFPQWVLDGAEYKQPGLTLASLLSLGGILAARRFTYGRSVSSLYVTAVAPTASGKGRPQGCLSHLLRTCWSQTLGPSDLSSTMSTINRISQACNNGVGMLLVLDEYGPRLRGLLDPKVSGHRADMRSLLLVLGTNGTQDYVAAQSLAAGGEDKLLQAPALSILGSSTPAALHEALGKASVDDGFLGRHLVFSSLDELPHRVMPRVGMEIPPALADGVKAVRQGHEAWHRSLPPNGTSTDGQTSFVIYKPMPIEDQGGFDVLEAYADAADARRRGGTGVDERVPAALLGRAAELAGRVCAGLAVLSQPSEARPIVSAHMARLACRIVDLSVETLAESIERHGASTEYGRDLLAIWAVIRGASGPDGWVSAKAISRVVRDVKRDDRNKIIDHLEEMEVVKVQRTKAPGGGHERIMVKAVADSLA